MNDIFDNEEIRTMETLKEKFLKLQDKLIKMEEDIQDFLNRLYDIPRDN